MSEKLFWENRYEDSMFPFIIFYISEQGILSDGQSIEGILWHDELQFSLVLSGQVTFLINGESYELKADEAVFINRAAFHETIKMTENCEYISLNFQENLLTFSKDSRMEESCVKPYTESNTFSGYKFTKGVNWQDEIIVILKRIWHIYNQKKIFGWEYDICVNLAMIWLRMIKNIEIENNDGQKSGQSQIERMQMMLRYIHQNYNDNLTLERIAAAANISVAECSRCFNDMISVSPYAYLIRYRLKRSIYLLIGSDYSITEIAITVGFQGAAHYIQTFKKQEGITPGQYRKKYKSKRKGI